MRQPPPFASSAWEEQNVRMAESQLLQERQEIERPLLRRANTELLQNQSNHRVVEALTGRRGTSPAVMRKKSTQDVEMISFRKQ